MSDYVTTYEAPSGSTFDLCPGCEHALSLTGDWPRDERGQEYSLVARDLHVGACDNCGWEAVGLAPVVGADEEES